MSESKTRTMQEWLDAYGVSHQNPLNKKIHWICVPLIFLSIVGLLWSIPKPWNVDYIWLNFATIAIIPVFLFYARLSFSLTIGMMLWCCFCFVFCGFYNQFIEIPLWQTSIVVFVLAWVGQFYGHKIEGIKPSFFEDLQFLMIGPAWLMSFIYNRLGIRY
tara:strand:+ start:185 stop:664 length:480 start_codon:yes stop_codon:yes gene_type:complete